MKLLTKALRKTLPALYASEATADPIALAKFFDPTGSWTWYATEASAILSDGRETSLAEADKLTGPAVYIEDVRFFGLVDGFEKEIGYFLLSELEAVRGRFGLGIERDRSFRATPLSKLGYGS